jgi:CTP:molybdopterin cytidylyltransferase MocA/HD superfamily phosphohydrolase YqeK
MRPLNHITAIIPAAGLSSRMKAFKPLLPLGNTTLLASTIQVFQHCGIRDIRVITGHRSEDIKPLIQEMGAVPIHNPDFMEGMFSTVLTGIRQLQPECGAFFMLPADIPMVRPHTVREILKAYQSGKGKIIYPFFEGQCGHPPLISCEYVPDILAWNRDGGLQACLKQFEGRSCNIMVCDEGIHMDADTPEDYQNLLSRTPDIPSTKECLCLLKHIRRLDEAIVRHCLKTAETAALICQALGRTSLTIHSDRVIKAALLHDMARNGRNHARLGSIILRDMGLGDIADIIRDHMDIITRPDIPLNETEIVYFADKITVNNTVEIDFENRFKKKLHAHTGDPAAVTAIKSRLRAAIIIRDKIEQATGRNISNIIDSND